MYGRTGTRWARRSEVRLQRAGRRGNARSLDPSWDGMIFIPWSAVFDGRCPPDPGQSQVRRANLRHRGESRGEMKVRHGVVSTIRDEYPNRMVDGWFRPELDECPEGGGRRTRPWSRMFTDTMRPETPAPTRSCMTRSRSRIATSELSCQRPSGARQSWRCAEGSGRF